MSEEEILLEKLTGFRRDLVIAYDSSQKFALIKTNSRNWKPIGKNS